MVNWGLIGTLGAAAASAGAAAAGSRAQKNAVNSATNAYAKNNEDARKAIGQGYGEAQNILNPYRQNNLFNLNKMNKLVYGKNAQTYGDSYASPPISYQPAAASAQSFKEKNVSPLAEYQGINTNQTGSNAGRILGGAAKGASMGANFGPLGAAIGGAAGALAGSIKGIFDKGSSKTSATEGLKQIDNHIWNTVMPAYDRGEISKDEVNRILGEAENQYSGYLNSKVSDGGVRKQSLEHWKNTTLKDATGRLAKTPDTYNAAIAGNVPDGQMGIMAGQSQVAPEWYGNAGQFDPAGGRGTISAEDQARLGQQQQAEEEPDYKTSELYKVQQEDGNKAINRSMAARGRSNSFFATKALSDFNRRLGAEEAEKYYGRVRDLTQMTMNPTMQMSDNAMGYGRNIAQLYGQQGENASNMALQQGINNSGKWQAIGTMAAQIPSWIQMLKK